MIAMKKTPNKVTVKVKRRDIWFGKRADRYSCPISRAVQRTLKRDAVAVSRKDVRVGIFYPETYTLPPEASEFVAQFDDYGDVKPFTFEMTEVS